MSMFSGKCDFYDGFVMIHSDGDREKVKENLKKLVLYVFGKDSRDHVVNSDTIKDIVKYYPYLESIAMYNKEDGFRIFLSSDSFIDLEEKEYRQWYVDNVLKYWRRCKRKKTPFDEEECFEKVSFGNEYNNLPLKEIIRRVAKDGDKAEFDDIHFSMWESFRQRWFEEMVKEGYTEQQAYNWCFKGRFDSKEKEEERLGRPVKDEIQSGSTE